MTTWAERAERREEFERDNRVTITELDYALNCAAIEIDTTNARDELAALRFDLRAARISAESYKAISIQAKEISDNVRAEYDRLNAELVALRAAAAERDELRAKTAQQAEQLEQAREAILKYRSLKLGPRGFCSENLFEHHNLADEWLAANAPQDNTA